MTAKEKLQMEENQKHAMMLEFEAMQDSVVTLSEEEAKLFEGYDEESQTFDTPQSNFNQELENNS